MWDLACIVSPLIPGLARWLLNRPSQLDGWARVSQSNLDLSREKGTKTACSWPRGGEIDIIEGVNLQWGNKATMHTNDGCSFDGTSCFSTANTGCGKPAGEFNAYGNGFNVNGGGVYAVEWTSDRISIWFFGRGSVPRDVLGHAPDPSRWGSPTANFAGGHGCNIDSHFRNHKIVFDTTFCGTVLVVDREVQSPFTYSKAGDWAGNVFSQDPSCAATGQSCQNYVRNNPGAFSEAYWTINALKVYSNDGSGPRVLSRENAPSTSALSIPNSGGSAFANTSIPVSSPPTATGSTYLRNTFTDLTSSAPPAEQAGSERESSTSPITTSSGSPTTPGTTTAVSYMTDGVVIETVPTAIVYHTLPPGEHASGNRYGFPDESADSNDGSPSTDDSSPGPQPTSNMKRAHRAARHLKRHIAAAKK